MPFQPDKREYRSCFSSFQAVEPQEGESPDGFVVEGYATTFDVPYEFGPPGYSERVDSRALEGADMSDVIFQIDHSGSPLARLRNGSLSISTDPHGLKVRADLGGSQSGRDAYEAIKSGLIDRMSWGFTIDDDGWEYDERTRTSTIVRVKKVFDVSAVTFPANSDTELHARSYLDGVIEASRRESLEREKWLRERAALRLRLIH